MAEALGCMTLTRHKHTKQGDQTSFNMYLLHENLHEVS